MPTVLVIDDDESVRVMLAAVLGCSGFRTLAAENGERALSIVQSDRPAVILCDGCMPGMSGVEVAACLRDHDATAGIPVIMMSGKPPSGEDLEQAGEPLGFLQKPFTPPELIAAVNSTLAKSDAMLSAEQP